MTDQSSLTQLLLFPEWLLPPKAPQNAPKLHRYWLQPQGLPPWANTSPTIMRYLDLLGPLHWEDFPERDLQRNWGQTTIPYAALAAADQGDTTYFFPLMRQVEERLGYRPRLGTFDAAFDAWYVYAYFYDENDPSRFAAVPFSEKGGYKANGRQFTPEGLPLCAAGLAMPLQFTYTDRTTCIVEHQRGKYVCPLLVPTQTARTCPIRHPNWKKGGCTVAMPTSIGARLRYTLDRKSEAYKAAYRQRTALERINSQAVALGIERPHLRNGQAITNQNTLIYILINLRFWQRLRARRFASD